MSPRALVASLILTWASAEDAVSSEASLQAPSLLVVRSHMPWQELLIPAAHANLEWFCRGARAFRCTFKLWPHAPEGREEFHPWFSRFYLGLLAMEDESAPDYVLWTSADTLFTRRLADVEEAFAPWLFALTADSPLVLEAILGMSHAPNMPRVYVARCDQRGHGVLSRLSSFLPREDRPFPRRRGEGALPHSFAFDGAKRAGAFGTFGQVQLLMPYAEASAVAEAGQDAFCTSTAACDAEGVMAEPPAKQPREASPGADLPFPPFLVQFSCDSERASDAYALARAFRAHNLHLGIQPASPAPRVDEDPGRGEVPHILLIVYGEEYARTRTPVFVRTLLATRSVPLRIYVLGDPPGITAFRRVLQVHGAALNLVRADDHLSMFTADASLFMSSFLSTIDERCHRGGYAYLFYKFLAPEFLPASPRVLVVDSDSLVLADVHGLWREFDEEQDHQALHMALDQSHRYYYRLQDPTDSIFSPGWVGVPHATGVNGGVALLNAVKFRAWGLAFTVAQATQLGTKERNEGRLESFCDLAEQDTINYLLVKVPTLLRQLDCRWNSMGTAVGGHRRVVLTMEGAIWRDVEGAEGVPFYLYDYCPNGPRGADGGPGDLLGCSCGARSRLVHFVGGLRRSPLFTVLNHTVFHANEAMIQGAAALWNRAPETLAEALNAAHGKSAEEATVRVPTDADGRVLAGAG